MTGITLGGRRRGDVPVIATRGSTPLAVRLTATDTDTFLLDSARALIVSTVCAPRPISKTTTYLERLDKSL